MEEYKDPFWTANFYNSSKLFVNPTRSGLWNGHREGGGLLKPAPIKTHLEAQMAKFLHRKGLGIKIT